MAASIVDLVEQVRDEIVAVFEEMYESLTEMAGDHPAFHPEMTPEERAQAYLPVWFVLGNAEPEVSALWWAMVADQEGWGPRAAAAFNAEMVRLFENERYQHWTWDAMPPDLEEFYQLLLDLGLHLGTRKLSLAELEEVREPPRLRPLPPPRRATLSSTTVT